MPATRRPAAKKHPAAPIAPAVPVVSVSGVSAATVSRSQQMDVWFAFGLDCAGTAKPWAEWSLSAALDADDVVKLELRRTDLPRSPMGDVLTMACTVSGKAEFDALVNGLVLLRDRFQSASSGWDVPASGWGSEGAATVDL